MYFLLQLINYDDDDNNDDDDDDDDDIGIKNNFSIQGRTKIQATHAATIIQQWFLQL